MLTQLNKSVFFFCFGISFFMNASPLPTSQEKNNIRATIKALTKTELKTLLNCYNPLKISRLSKQYKIFELSIENKNEQEYVLEPSSINLKLEKKLALTSKFKSNPIIVPAATFATTTTLFILGLGFAVLPSVIAGATIGITSLNIDMQKSNTISTKNIQTKMLDAQHPLLIPSFSKIQKVIFVLAKNNPNNLTITIESLDAQQKFNFDFPLTK